MFQANLMHFCIHLIVIIMMMMMMAMLRNNQVQAMALQMRKSVNIESITDEDNRHHQHPYYRSVQDHSNVEINEIDPSYTLEHEYLASSTKISDHKFNKHHQQQVRKSQKSMTDQQHFVEEKSTNKMATKLDTKDELFEGKVDKTKSMSKELKRDYVDILHALQKQFVEQVIKQRIADGDHLLMEKWLVDNINDLHRELKQTEMDFEHYVQVTKNILARKDLEHNNYVLKRHLALQTSLPLSIPLRTVQSSSDQTDEQVHNYHQHH